MKEQNKNLTLEDELYRAGLVFLAAGAVGIFISVKWLVPALEETECIFQKLWGIYCPGCGGTRAVLALLEGNFLESLWYHPIVLYTVVIFGWFMLSHTLEKIHFPLIRGLKFHVWHMYGALAVIVINCILKNVLKIGFHIVM